MKTISYTFCAPNKTMEAGEKHLLFHGRRPFRPIINRYFTGSVRAE